MTDPSKDETELNPMGYVKPIEGKHYRMTDKEPTQEQQREFWEWCGLRQFNTSDKVAIWLDATGMVVSPITDGLPTLDLNNLFKYAVPKLIERVGKHQAYLLLSGCLSKSILDDKCLEDEILWAIWEVIRK